MSSKRGVIGWRRANIEDVVLVLISFLRFTIVRICSYRVSLADLRTIPVDVPGSAFWVEFNGQLLQETVLMATAQNDVRGSAGDDLLHNGSDDEHNVLEYHKENDTCEENDVERGSHFVRKHAFTEVEVAAVSN